MSRFFVPSQTTSSLPHYKIDYQMEFKKQDSAYFSLSRQQSLDAMHTPLKHESLKHEPLKHEPLKHERYDSDGSSTIFQDSPGSSIGSGRTERSSSTASLGPRHAQNFSGQLAHALVTEKVVPQEARNVKRETGKNAISRMVRRDLIRTYSSVFQQMLTAEQILLSTVFIPGFTVILVNCHLRPTSCRP